MTTEGIQARNLPTGTDIGGFLGYQLDGTNAKSLKLFSKEQVLATLDGFGGGAVTFVTKAQADANLAYDQFTMSWVIEDDDAGSNGVYQKLGASGSGSWDKVADLPYSFYRAVNAGAGTANAIIATNTKPLASPETLIAFNITTTNTSASVTVALNGGTALNIKTAAGNNPAVGALQADMLIAGYISGSTFRLISDLSSAAIQAAAEAAQAAAEDARDLAIAAADQAAVEGAGDVPTYPNRTLAIAATIPTARTYVYLAGWAAKGDFGGGLYKKLSVTPSPVELWHFQSADTAYWELSEREVFPEQFGGKGDGAITGDPIAGYTVSGTDDKLALQAHADYAAACGVKCRYLGKIYATSETINWPANVRYEGIKGATWIAALSGGTWTSGAAPAGGAVVDCSGSLVALPDLASAAGKNALSVTLASTPTIDPEDVLVIYNPTDNSWMTDTNLGNLRPYYRDGEMVRVRNKSGATVYLMTPLMCRTFSNYATADNEIYRIPKASIDISCIGFHAPRSGNVMGLNLSLLTDVKTDGITVRNSLTQSMQTDRCFNVLHVRPTLQGLGPSGETYGYANSNCQNVIVLDPIGEALWHPIANTGNDDDGCVPTTNVEIRGGYLSASVTTASDAHGGSDHVRYIDVLLYNGASFGGNGSLHQGCTIIGGSVEGGICVLGSEVLGGDHIFDNCTFQTEGSPTGSRGNIDVGGNSNVLSSDTARASRLIIRNCTLSGAAIDAGVTAVKVGTHTSLAVPFDVIIDGLKGPSQLTEILRYTTGGAQQPAIVAVDNIEGFDANASLAVFPSGLSSATWLRQMRQTGQQDITCTSGLASASHAGQNFRYKYTVAPHLTCGLKERAGDDSKEVCVGVHTAHLQYARLSITKSDGSNFTSTVTRRATWVASVDGPTTVA